MISKSEFLLFLDSPIHFWAARHGQIEAQVLSPYEEYLIKQGQQVENLAQPYLQHYLERKYPKGRILWQPVYEDGEFTVRADAVLIDNQQGDCHLFEIKSAVTAEKKYIIDVAFQALVLEKNLSLTSINLLHLNKEYIFEKELDLDSLFTITNVDQAYREIRADILALREQAREVDGKESPLGLSPCRKPKVCPCPQICHPHLEAYPLYDIPRLSEKKLQALKDAGVEKITDIPSDFPLTERQKVFCRAVKDGGLYVDHEALIRVFHTLVYPLYFLDYETCNPAIPWFEGYRPYQTMVFQYSLHVQEQPAGEYQHYEFVADESHDAPRQLLPHLQSHLSAGGTVLVWNKSFEMARNREMAEMYPDYSTYLEEINHRMFDLMDVFSKGIVIHPDFHGSASIKNVLPVLVPDLNYESLKISRGEDAMLSWMRLMTEPLSFEERQSLLADLKEYCRLDTLAMVEILQKLWDISSNL